jgi:glycine C-acetyltransferase
MVDDSHAVGFLGAHGKGSPEYCGVEGRIDFLTGTFGKALGGASGGYTSGKRETIEWLRQRSRPYLFSNTLAPSLVAATSHVLDMLQNGDDLRNQLNENSRFFREQMSAAGFRLIPGEHPIIPIMLEDALLTQAFASQMLEQDVYVIGFNYPVVPQGKARIRTQISAAHTRSDLEQAVKSFITVGRNLKVI